MKGVLNAPAAGYSRAVLSGRRTREDPDAGVRRITLPANDVLFSAARILEIAIKLQLGRIECSVTPDDIVAAAEEMGFVELPVRAAYAAGARRLPLYHRDPMIAC